MKVPKLWDLSIVPEMLAGYTHKTPYKHPKEI